MTPEATTREIAFGRRPPQLTITLTGEDFAAALRELSTVDGGVLAAVSVGTPHFSVPEFQAFVTLLNGRRIADSVECYISTGREVLSEIAARGWERQLIEAGVKIVTDTCTYITPILSKRPGAVMTNSAKWAWYAPGNLGVAVVFGALRECVESAVRGTVWRQDWSATDA